MKVLIRPLIQLLLTLKKSKIKDFIEKLFPKEVIYILALILLMLPTFYLFYVKNRQVSEQYSHFYVKEAYDEKNLIDQVELMEQRFNKKYSKFKALIKRYNSISKGNLFKYSDKIDNQMFCYLLNGRSRYKLFWEMIDPFFLIILSYLLLLVLLITGVGYIYYGIIGMLIACLVSSTVVYFMISFLISFTESLQFSLRKNKKYLGGVNVSLFALNALLKLDINKSYDSSTGLYTYSPHIVLYAAASGSGFGGGFGGFGGGFGGGGFSGGGAGGSW
ncbi:hypothetical protein [Carboxylicivirga caseinilyticus]|uniref:hypothetical protein n=1 Tax=Carboxylicivirga caseinilyticus TaxID=3417572 RepID=UPI003D33EE58|nr:hypothetical protein [Marinilabiliaceae bacterium A049]